jgi:hypothetical protein
LFRNCFFFLIVVFVLAARVPHLPKPEFQTRVSARVAQHGQHHGIVSHRCAVPVFADNDGQQVPEWNHTQKKKERKKKKSELQNKLQTAD